jgi:hypothetical protein
MEAKPGRASIGSAPLTVLVVNLGDDPETGDLGEGFDRRALPLVAVLVGADIGRRTRPQLSQGR